MRRHQDGVFFVQRRDGVIDINVLHPVVGVCVLIQFDFDDGKKKTPYKNKKTTTKNIKKEIDKKARNAQLKKKQMITPK